MKTTIRIDKELVRQIKLFQLEHNLKTIEDTIKLVLGIVKNNKKSFS